MRCYGLGTFFDPRARLSWWRRWAAVTGHRSTGFADFSFNCIKSACFWATFIGGTDAPRHTDSTWTRQNKHRPTGAIFWGKKFSPHFWHPQTPLAPPGRGIGYRRTKFQMKRLRSWAPSCFLRSQTLGWLLAGNMTSRSFIMLISEMHVTIITSNGLRRLNAAGI